VPTFFDPVVCLDGLSSRPIYRFYNDSKTYSVRLCPPLSPVIHQNANYSFPHVSPPSVFDRTLPKAGFHTRNCLQMDVDSVHWYPHTGLSSRRSLSVFNRSRSSSIFCHTQELIRFVDKTRLNTAAVNRSRLRGCATRPGKDTLFVIFLI